LTSLYFNQKTTVIIGRFSGIIIGGQLLPLQLGWIEILGEKAPGISAWAKQCGDRCIICVYNRDMIWGITGI
jgi:hypothetical protein